MSCVREGLFLSCDGRYPVFFPPNIRLENMPGLPTFTLSARSCRGLALAPPRNRPFRLFSRSRSPPSSWSPHCSPPVGISRPSRILSFSCLSLLIPPSISSPSDLMDEGFKHKVALTPPKAERTLTWGRVCRFSAFSEHSRYKRVLIIPGSGLQESPCCETPRC